MKLSLIDGTHDTRVPSVGTQQIFAWAYERYASFTISAAIACYADSRAPHHRPLAPSP